MSREGSVSKRAQEELRVNHVGEYGAFLIYSAQVKALKERGAPEAVVAAFEEALVEEREHFRVMDDFMRQHKVRPSALMPLWRVCASLAARLTVLMGTEVAFLFTRKVEDVVVQHYVSQLQALKDEPEMSRVLQTVQKICDEEMAHYEEASQACDERKFPQLAVFMKVFTKIAIFLSKKI